MKRRLGVDDGQWVVGDVKSKHLRQISSSSRHFIFAPEFSTTSAHPLSTLFHPSYSHFIHLPTPLSRSLSPASPSHRLTSVTSCSPNPHSRFHDIISHRHSLISRSLFIQQVVPISFFRAAAEICLFCIASFLVGQRFQPNEDRLVSSYASHPGHAMQRHSHHSQLCFV